MPIVLRVDGFLIRIYLPSREHGPAHVQVFRGDAEVVILLNTPHVGVSIREVNGMRRSDVQRAVAIVAEHADFYDGNGGSIMTKERIPSVAEIDAQIPAARARGADARKAGLRAQSAWYDPAGRRVMLLLTNDVVVGIPVGSIPYLTKATTAQLFAVTVTPTGSGICWDKIDVDLSVEGLLVDTFGRTPFLAAMGRIAGQAKSIAKAEAARANGAKGGRPRKRSVA